MRFEHRDSFATRTPDVDLETAIHETFSDCHFAMLITMLHANGALKDADIAAMVKDRFSPVNPLRG
jgi:hypothetical protein